MIDKKILTYFYCTLNLKFGNKDNSSYIIFPDFSIKDLFQIYFLYLVIRKMNPNNKNLL
jgi:hypothetical protein